MFECCCSYLNVYPVSDWSFKLLRRSHSIISCVSCNRPPSAHPVSCIGDIDVNEMCFFILYDFEWKKTKRVDCTYNLIKSVAIAHQSLSDWWQVLAWTDPENCFCTWNLICWNQVCFFAILSPMSEGNQSYSCLYNWIPSLTDTVCQVNPKDKLSIEGYLDVEKEMTSVNSIKHSAQIHISYAYTLLVSDLIINANACLKTASNLCLY